MFRYYFLCVALCLSVASSQQLNRLDATILQQLPRVGSFDARANTSSGLEASVVYSISQWNATTNTRTTGLRSIQISTNGLPTGAPVSLTSIQGKSDASPIFSPDGQYIAFLSDRSGSTQAWVVPTSGGTPQQVTFYPLSIANLRWSQNRLNFLVFTTNMYPDCKDMTCTAQRDAGIKARGPNTGFVFESLYVRHWDRYSNGKASHIFFQAIQRDSGSGTWSTVGNAVDIMAGMSVNSPVPPFGGAEEFSIHPNGKELAFTGEILDYETAWTTGWQIFRATFDVNTGIVSSVISITDSYTQARTQNPAYSHNGAKLAFLAMDRPGNEADRLHLVLFDLSSKTFSLVANGFDRSIAGIVWSLDDTAIIADTDNEGRHALWKIPVTGPSAAAALLVNDGTSNSVVFIRNDLVYFASRSYTSPTNVVRGLIVGSGTAVVSPLTHEADVDMDPLWLSTPEYFTFNSGNETNVQGWFFKPFPDFKADSSWPLALLIHGGPESAWNSGWSTSWNPQLWTARGYAVVMINPRGSTGFGTAFTDAVRGDWGGAPYRDIMNGVQYITAKYPQIDYQRMCACGGSYGGFMVNWINGQTNLFKCLVNHDGTFDTRAKYFSTDELWFQEWQFGGPPWNATAAALYQKWSPVNFVENWNTPMLIIHGEKDYRVPFEEGLSTFTALQRKGVKSRLLAFPDEGHWVLNPYNGIQWTNEVLGWLDKFTS